MALHSIGRLYFLPDQATSLIILAAYKMIISSYLLLGIFGLIYLTCMLTFYTLHAFHMAVLG